MHHRVVLGAWFGIAVALTLTARATASPDPFAECRKQFADKPRDYDSAYCFYRVAIRQQLWDDGVRAFDALERAHAGNFWLPLAYGHLFRDRDPDRAEALYRRAADGFQRQRDPGGEILARTNLRGFLAPKGRLKEAGVEMERVSALESATDDPLLKAQVWAAQAAHLQDTGGDLGSAYRLLRQTHRTVFPGGGYRQKRSCLSLLGGVTFQLGRADEALGIYQELDQLAAAEGDAREQAIARYNILNIYSMKETVLPTPGGRQRLLNLAESTLDIAQSAQHALVAVKTHRTIAALLAHDSGRRSDALAHVKECLSIAAAIRQPHDEAVCSWVEASIVRGSAPAQVREAEVRALAATVRANSPVTHAYSAGRSMRLSWATRPRADAIRHSLAAIDAIETLRSLQEGPESTAELFSAWTHDYYWFSGSLLRGAEPADLDLAFSITERMRARSLLDRLERARTRLDPAHPLAVERRSLLEAIAPLQRRLMDPILDGRSRRSTLDELEQLEHRDQDLQRRIALATNDRRPNSPAFSSLDGVRAALADDEALLSFQVGTWDTSDGEFGGGSWLIAVSRGATAVFRLPDRTALSTMVPVFSGLVTRGDNSGRQAATRLHSEILGAALKGLSPGIRRLIIIPDGPLHRLPFDALRAAPDAAPLTAHYELVVAPSATLWLHWQRNGPARTAGSQTLALADPELDAGAVADSAQRNAVLHQGLLLGRLPHARRESRSLERHLRDVDALVGVSASERALKERDLRAYKILHFAAHAVADDAHPERSAVLLSRGSDREDGLLQAREIANLDLDGSVVVLSACQTAAGPVQSGEGVLSLARAFFAAGAQSVIGTRWPIRDEDAAALFDTFYRALGEGATLSQALTRAKREAIAAGRPAAAWASLVVLGNGTLRPFPGGVAARPPSLIPPVALVTLALLVAAAVPFYRAARRRRRDHVVTP
jgi:CHAT domain-containing protein/tetratricopeptide (TPR) repeat protein